jgi:putative membrane protein
MSSNNKEKRGSYMSKKNVAVFIATAALSVLPALAIAQTPTTPQSSPPTQTPPATPTPQPRPGTSQPPSGNPPATEPMPMGTAQTQKGSTPDRHFAMDAAAGGLAEVELGKLASDHASNAEVKKFGQRMVEDHGKANDELSAILKQKGISPPTALEGKQKALHDRLSKLNGAEFDRAYIAAMVKDHQEDAKDFEHESKNGKDPDLKAFAAKTLPMIQDHLKMARDIQTKLGGATNE